MSTTPKPTVEEKANLNQKIRQNIREFIQIYVAPRFKYMVKRNDPYSFVEQMNGIWANFQRFVFAHDFLVDKLRQFFESFYKMSVAKNFERDGEVVSVPVIGVNELKLFFTDKKHNILEVFPRNFSNFIAK